MSQDQFTVSRLQIPLICMQYVYTFARLSSKISYRLHMTLNILPHGTVSYVVFEIMLISSYPVLFLAIPFHTPILIMSDFFHIKMRIFVPLLYWLYSFGGFRILLSSVSCRQRFILWPLTYFDVISLRVVLGFITISSCACIEWIWWFYVICASHIYWMLCSPSVCRYCMTVCTAEEKNWFALFRFPAHGSNGSVTHFFFEFNFEIAEKIPGRFSHTPFWILNVLNFEEVLNEDYRNAKRNRERRKKEKLSWAELS